MRTEVERLKLKRNCILQQRFHRYESEDKRKTVKSGVPGTKFIFWEAGLLLYILPN